MKPIDLTGMTFGRWTVASRGPNTPTGQATWLCRCECGNEKTLKSIVIRRGLSRSCGCLKREDLVRRFTKHGHSPASGVSPTYGTWAVMVQRCTNTEHSRYPWYGGRGITVCKRWLKFTNFLADMGEKPEGMTIERIRNNRGYGPGNCRWATMKQQGANKRNNRLVTFRGETHHLAEWARLLGIKRATLHDRLRRGWTVEDALATSTRPMFVPPE